MKVTNSSLYKELQAAEKEREMLEHTNKLKIEQFIGEIKNGLGTEIKKRSNKPIFIKRPWYYKVKMFFKKIFTNF